MRNGAFARQVRLLGEQAIAKSDKVRKKIAAEAMGHVVLASPIQHGRFAGNWQVSEGSPKDGVLEVMGTSKEDAARIRQQAADKALAFVARSEPDSSLWLVNNLPYAAKLELEGHSQQAPNGMIGPMMANLPAIIKAAMNEGGR